MNRKIPITLMSLLILLVPSYLFGSTFPDKPPSEHCYVDEAGLISPEVGGKIDAMAAALLYEEKMPLFVVTIPSLASHGAVTLNIEQYAAELFNDWGIGWQDRNYGRSEKDSRAQ